MSITLPIVVERELATFPQHVLVHFQHISPCRCHHDAKRKRFYRTRNTQLSVGDHVPVDCLPETITDVYCIEFDIVQQNVNYISMSGPARTEADNVFRGMIKYRCIDKSVIAAFHDQNQKVLKDR